MSLCLSERNMLVRISESPSRLADCENLTIVRLNFKEEMQFLTKVTYQCRLRNVYGR